MSIQKITIAGLNMDGPEGQAWEFASGAGSPEIPFIASGRLNDALETLPPGKPVPLEFEGVHFERNSATEGRTSFLRVEGLYLTRRQDVVRGHRHRWFISDVRLFFQKLWVFTSFNARRPLNTFKRFGVGEQRFFNQTAKLGYLTHTMRKPGTVQMASGDDDPLKVEPWTAFQACQFLLSHWIDIEGERLNPPGLGPGWRPTIDITDATDNGRVLVEQRTNKPWPFVMQKMLDKAHLGLYVAHDMKFKLYDLKPAELPARVGGYRGGGVPVFQDAQRIRPRNVRVYFRTEREARFDYIETQAGASNQTTRERGKRDVSLGLRNVLILPQDVKEPSTGKTYLRGQIVTIEKALDLWNNDPDNPPPELLGPKGQGQNQRLKFNLDFIRKNIMSPAMATRMTLMPRFANNRDDVFAARASALYKSYRQIFQVPLPWLEMMEGIRAERTAIMDPITGKRAPAPVFMDFFQEYSGRYFHYKAAPKDLKAGANVFAWSSSNPAANPNGRDLRNVSDISRLGLDIGQVAPARVTFVNKRQGVFRVSFLPDLYGNTTRLIPATFADDKIPVSLLGGTAKTWLTSQMEFSPFWRMSVVLTVVMRTPNDHRRLHFIDFGKAGAADEQVSPDAMGPNHEVLFSSLHAGFAWNDDTSKVDIQGGTVSIEGGDLTNAEVLEDAAKAVLKDVNFKMQDRVLGVFAGPGYDPARDRPSGSVTTVRIQHTNGRLETIHDAKNPPVPPPFFTLLPTASANFLFRIEGEPEQ